MAKGFKDWDVPVNISAQEISQVTTRPKYGAAQIIGSSQIVPSNQSVILFSITGKGVTYGGFVLVDATVTKKDDRITTVVDDISLTGREFVTLFDRNLIKPSDDIIHLIKYDDVNFIYVAGLMPGMTFESSLSFIYYSVGAFSSPVVASLIYALVT